MLDKKDKKILYLLDKNSRQPLSEIAKKVKLSRESILYRQKKYFSEGILKDYLTVIDMAKLGFTHYKAFIKLHNINKGKEEEFIKYLVKSPSITWIGSCDGKYSLIFAVKARSIVELDKTMREINQKYGKFIMEQDIAAIIRGSHFYRDYLSEGKGSTERKIYWGGKPKEFKLDKINTIILDEISKNSRVSAVDIANKTRVSPDAVIKRIKSLQAANIIEHYMIWPNVNELKGIYYKVLISLKNLDNKREEDLIDYCKNHPNIVYIVNSLGPWQFEIDMEVSNIGEFRTIIRDLLNKFPDVISDYTALNIFEEHKYRFFEKDLLRN